MTGKRVLSRLWRVLASFLLFVLTPSGAAASGWEWQNPLPQGVPLRGLWGASGTDMFAVGDGGTVLHGNGTAWSVMPSGTADPLNGVWGTSGTDVFAVGETGSILHHGASAAAAALPALVQLLLLQE